jgi:hypothetical protein
LGHKGLKINPYHHRNLQFQKREKGNCPKKSLYRIVINFLQDRKFPNIAKKGIAGL